MVAIQAIQNKRFCNTKGILGNALCTLTIFLSLSPELRTESHMNQVAAVQHEAWATLGFLRGVSSLPLSGQAFCTPQWVQLMMEVITGASPLNKQDPTGRSLLKQVNIYVM